VRLVVVALGFCVFPRVLRLIGVVMSDFDLGFPTRSELRVAPN
jgi:hypothetical protein